MNLENLSDPGSHLKEAIYNLNLTEALKAVALGVKLNEPASNARPLLFQVLGYPALKSDILSIQFEVLNHARFVMSEFLIQNGLLVDSIDESSVEIGNVTIGRITPLHYAVLLNDCEGIQYLVKKGANVSFKVSIFTLSQKGWIWSKP